METMTGTAHAKLNLEAAHRFHTYCARFPSGVAETAILEHSRRGESILDPFCGSGTSLVAGLAHRRRVVGADIDILAGMLSEVKCSAHSPDDYAVWRRPFAEKLGQVFSDIELRWPPSRKLRPGSALSLGSLVLRLPSFPELNYWFPPQLIAALAAIAEAAHDCPDSHYEKVALVSLSASIIAKWPNTLSYAMDIDHTRPHRRVRQFRLGAVLQTYLQRLDRTIACLGSLHSAYGRAGVTEDRPNRTRLLCPHDARLPLPDVADGSQAMVVTSPPYFNAVDYPRAHRMSVCWMNGHAPTELASRHDYIGLHRAATLDSTGWFSAQSGIQKLIPQAILADATLARRVAGFFADLDKALLEIWRVLRPGGHAVFIIGDNVIKGQRVPSHLALLELGRMMGFSKRQASPREIVSLRRRYPVGPFGFDGPMTHEFVVILQKPRPRRKSHARPG